MELELAVKRTLEDTDKIKEQINSILTALVNKSQITEVGLTTFGDEGNDSAQSSSCNADKESSFVPTTDFDKLKSLFTEDGHLGCKAIFKVLNSETFFIPFYDKWIWGTTVVNDSDFAASLPELHLMLADDIISDGHNRNHVFLYNYSVSLAEVPVDLTRSKSQKLEDFVNIPFHRMETDNSDETIKVQPGCKALVTASFGDSMRKSSKTSITASIFCNKSHQWTSSYEVKTSLAFSYDETILERFRPQIFSVLTAHQRDYFKIERRFSRADKFPSKVFHKFLTYLGFNLITSVQTGIDIWVDTLAVEKPTLLFGLLVKIERNIRDVDSNQCSVAARSPEQMDTFRKLFLNWVTKESSEDRRRGLKGIVVSNSSQGSNENLKEQLLREVKLVEHLISLNDISSEFSRKWLRAYVLAAAQVDLHFIHESSASIKLSTA